MCVSEGGGRCLWHAGGTEERRIRTEKWPRQMEHSGKGTRVQGVVREGCKQGGTQTLKLILRSDDCMDYGLGWTQCREKGVCC